MQYQPEAEGVSLEVETYEDGAASLRNFKTLLQTGLTLEWCIIGSVGALFTFETGEQYLALGAGLYSATARKTLDTMLLAAGYNLTEFCMTLPETYSGPLPR